MTEQIPNPSKDAPEQPAKHEDLISLTSEIVGAYVGNNAVSTTDVPALIETVYRTLSQVGAPATPELEQEPAVPVRRSVKKDSITCLECGKAQKMLKRHLGAAHGMTPEEYRAKWNLRPDYPMVAPDYTEKRRDLANRIGLGRKPGKALAKRGTRPRKSG